ncbi:MAG: hypothetical protein P4M10_04550, partial [Verrucomicrobiae bacterium]|nr:hypothetical protein [Verrucomicrobiae bacterium]
EGAQAQSAALAAEKAALESEVAASHKAQTELRRLLDTEVDRLTTEITALKAERATGDEKIDALTRELAAGTQVETQLRTQLAEQKQALEAQTHTLNVELSNLKDLEAARSALEEKIQTLTQALATETQRAEDAEAEVSEISQERNNLAAELAESNEAQAGLSAELVDQKQLASRTAAELAKLRQTAAAQAERQEQLAQKLAATEKAKADLEQQLAARQLLLTQREETLRAAETELQRRHEEQTRLAGSLQEEIAQRHHAEERIRCLQTELNEKTALFVHKCETEKAGLDREVALQKAIQERQNELAESAAEVASQKAANKKSRQKIQELEERETALRAKVDELTGAGQASAKAIQELKAKGAQLEREGETGRRELAGLRYAILDASRMNALLQRQGTQQDRQKVDAMRQLAMLLAQTPLSLAQQNLLGDLQSAVDGFKHNRGNGIQAPLYPIELPCFRQSEFSPSKVTESACGPVRLAAEAAGVAVRIAITGPATARAKGNAEHLHQLITLLAVSPLTLVSGINAIDLRAAWNPKGGTAAELDLRIALSTKEKNPDLLNLLIKATATVPAAQTAPLSTAEFGLAAGWQLAMALGARTRIELQNGKEACLLVAVPVELVPETAVERNEAPPVNGNGQDKTNGHAGRNGKENLLVANPN